MRDKHRDILISPTAVSDEDEAAALFATHFQPLVAWCVALVGNREIGQDIAAEAFVRLLAHWGRVRSPKPFVYAVAANLVRDYWRHSQRRGAPDAKVGASAEPSEELAYLNVELRELVQGLPRRLRVPVLLHYYADCSIAEIARSTRRPTGTVKRQLAEARELLRNKIGD